MPSEAAASGVEPNESEFETKCLLYKMQLVEGLKKINQDLMQIENNMKSLAERSGPFKSQLSGFLASIPAPELDFLNMETD